MNVFIDTSAFLAILDADDDNHLKAKTEWIKMISDGAILICNNYILVETVALVQHRLGLKAVKTFQKDVLPVVHIKWIDEITHKVGMSALIASSKRKLSLVDCISFETMRQLGIHTAFTLDSHFHKQGFRCVPK